MDEVEQQISILLNLLGGQSADVILKGLPKERAERIRSRVKKYRHTPPDPADVEQVLAEVDRLMRRLDRAAPARKPRQGEREPAGSSDRADAKDAPSEPAFQPSGDPVADLQRLQPLRVAGALATETPRAAAALLASLPSQQAGAIARLLPVELR